MIKADVAAKLQLYLSSNFPKHPFLHLSNAHQVYITHIIWYMCTFAGHKEIYRNSTLKEKLKQEIINLAEHHGVNTFYNSGKGDFDWLCDECVNELKNDYPSIKSYLILAYMPGKKNQFNVNL